MNNEPTLFPEDANNGPIALAAGAVLLPQCAIDQADELLAAIHDIARVSPWRHMVTRGGFRMSVAMTNCGRLGWFTDRRGYRYTDIDPDTSEPWPALPTCFLDIAQRAATEAGCNDFVPDACLINRYEPGAKMALHQDRNERDYDAPIVSVSLGLTATFLFGGMQRDDRPQRIKLDHGDVVVWGGPSRLAFHGVAPLRKGEHPATGNCRYNLTFRKAG